MFYGGFCIASTDRSSMGTYLCVNTNGVALAVSKRIQLIVLSELTSIPTNSAYKTVSIQPNVLYISAYICYQSHCCYSREFINTLRKDSVCKTTVERISIELASLFHLDQKMKEESLGWSQGLYFLDSLRIIN